MVRLLSAASCVLVLGVGHVQTHTYVSDLHLRWNNMCAVCTKWHSLARQPLRSLCKLIMAQLQRKGSGDFGQVFMNFDEQIAA